MRIAICDNEQFYVQDILERVKNYEIKDIVPNVIDCFSNGNDLLNAFQREPYDLVYLDIELDSQENGIEIAKKLKILKANCIFVFITSYPNYVHESIWVGVDQFINKPIDDTLFNQELKHAVHLYKSLNRTLLFSTTVGKKYIKTDKILYLETSYGKYKLCTVERPFFGSLKSIRNVRQQLLDYHFFQLNRSIIINFKHVFSFKFDYVIMSNEDMLPLTRRKRKEFKEKYFDYIDKEM